MPYRRTLPSWREVVSLLAGAVLQEESGSDTAMTASGVEQQRVTIGTPNRRALHPLAHGILVPTPTLSGCADTGTAARPAQCGSALH